MINLKKAVGRLGDALEKAKRYNIELDQPVDESSGLLNFNERKKAHTYKILKSSLEDVKKNLVEVNAINVEGDNELKVQEIVEIVKGLESKNTEKMARFVKRLNLLLENFVENESVRRFDFRVPVPEEIKSEILADIKEMDKCLNNGCYRSSVILCGRILETALHRKYFETTEVDLLEKSPGIGLGKIIAKLEEKGVKLDPGLTQQIHLINQIRIFSVHTKKETFYPSKEQAEAMILFTMDVLKKLF